MSISIFLARTLGLYLIIVGFFYLLRRKAVQKAAEQIFESESLIIITAVISLIIGLLIVIGHNIWEWNWTLMITLLGYLGLIKGFLRLFFPQHVDKCILKKLLAKDNPIYIGIISLILGFFLTYEGFFTKL